MLDLVGDNTAADTVDIDALAQASADAIASGETADEVAEPVATEAATEPNVQEAPEPELKTVPIQQFERLYGKTKELERRAAFLEQQLARNDRQTVPEASRQPADLRPEAKFLQESMRPLLAPFEETLGKLAAKEKINDAKASLNDFWAENADYAAYRAKVDSTYLGGIRNGVNPDEVSPELILDALIGQAQRNSVASRKAVAAESVRKVAKANSTARAETGHTASAQPKSVKPNSKKTAAEMEEEWGDEIIYSKER